MKVTAESTKAWGAGHKSGCTVTMTTVRLPGDSEQGQQSLGKGGFGRWQGLGQGVFQRASKGEAPIPNQGLASSDDS
jgi:hypothetical protein